MIGIAETYATLKDAAPNTRAVSLLHFNVSFLYMVFACLFVCLFVCLLVCLIV